jgi:hypothetical protein
MDLKFIGKIVQYDPMERLLQIQIDFLTPEKESVIEDILESKNSFTFWFGKPFRRMKTYPQLQRYFWMLKCILQSQDIYPSAEATKTLDMYFKKKLCKCDYVDFREDGKIKRIPIIPSKADMTVEELSQLIQDIQEMYESIINWETGKRIEQKGFE